eukprot:TRINITY_DN17168_c0_g2_i1.p1 TRINITY_DN17168_c0_g2~~TRINITY_DN17168_c0_g2_i1.p1  ORF type:complete len:850 (-),score=212.70 TRINITY_DN17168_c0_g2_i1:244-2793(-)
MVPPPIDVADEDFDVDRPYSPVRPLRSVQSSPQKQRGSGKKGLLARTLSSLGGSGMRRSSSGKAAAETCAAPDGTFSVATASVATSQQTDGEKSKGLYRRFSLSLLGVGRRRSSSAAPDEKRSESAGEEADAVLAAGENKENEKECTKKELEDLREAVKGLQNAVFLLQREQEEMRGSIILREQGCHLDAAVEAKRVGSPLVEGRPLTTSRGLGPWLRCGGEAGLKGLTLEGNETLAQDSVCANIIPVELLVTPQACMKGHQRRKPKAALQGYAKPENGPEAEGILAVRRQDAMNGEEKLFGSLLQACIGGGSGKENAAHEILPCDLAAAGDLELAAGYGRLHHTWGHPGSVVQPLPLRLRYETASGHDCESKGRGRSLPAAARPRAFGRVGAADHLAPSARPAAMERAVSSASTAASYGDASSLRRPSLSLPPPLQQYQRDSGSPVVEGMPRCLERTASSEGVSPHSREAPMSRDDDGSAAGESLHSVAPLPPGGDRQTGLPPLPPELAMSAGDALLLEHLQSPQPPPLRSRPKARARSAAAGAAGSAVTGKITATPGPQAESVSAPLGGGRAASHGRLGPKMQRSNSFENCDARDAPPSPPRRRGGAAGRRRLQAKDATPLPKFGSASCASSSAEDSLMLGPRQLFSDDSQTAAIPDRVDSRPPSPPLPAAAQPMGDSQVVCEAAAAAGVETALSPERTLQQKLQHIEEQLDRLQPPAALESPAALATGNSHSSPADLAALEASAGSVSSGRPWRQSLPFPECDSFVESNAGDAVHAQSLMKAESFVEMSSEASSQQLQATAHRQPPCALAALLHSEADRGHMGALMATPRSPAMPWDEDDCVLEAH